MDVSLFINQRLQELQLEQKDLALAAEVTESYISQLLTRRKSPPAPNRTDIYAKMERCLKLPAGELTRLAAAQRRHELARELGQEPMPLFPAAREMILRKCNVDKMPAVRTVLDRQPFGELERLVIRKMLEVTRPVAEQELNNEGWLRTMSRLSGQELEAMRSRVVEFLDAEFSAVSVESCVSLLEPMIRSWDIDLGTFDLEIVLNHSVPTGHVKRFGFREHETEASLQIEPGLEEFLADPGLSGSVTAPEIEFLKRLRFGGRRPTALYYYRELQNLRDPLHFRATAA